MVRPAPVAPQASAEETAGPCWARGMIHIECREAVALLTLDRADKLNAIDRRFWEDLPVGLDWAVQQGMRVILFTGAGKRAFSVGGDIGSFAELTTAEARETFQTEAMAAFEAVAACPIPTIAAINGLALGGGCELAMACDFVLAARSAKLGLPEARFGLVPGYGVLAASAIVGVQMARLLIFTGESLTAEDALRCGLVQRVCEDNELVEEGLRLANVIATTSPHAIATAKAMLDKRIEPEAIALSIAEISKLHATSESKEAVARFLEAHHASQARKA